MKFGRIRTWRKRLGDAGELAAARYFRETGMTVLLHSCRTPKAEIDLIARDGAVLVFAEVKSMFFSAKQAARDIRPADRLSNAQKLRIIRGAYAYMDQLEAPDGMRFRFDLVEVIFDRTGPVKLLHHPAFLDQAKRHLLEQHHLHDNPVPARVFKRRKGLQIS